MLGENGSFRLIYSTYALLSGRSTPRIDRDPLRGATKLSPWQ
jgi:hypothetical protein